MKKLLMILFLTLFFSVSSFADKLHSTYQQTEQWSKQQLNHKAINQDILNHLPQGKLPNANLHSDLNGNAMNALPQNDAGRMVVESFQTRPQYKIEKNDAMLQRAKNEAKAKAVLQPSIENLKNYLVLQQQVTNQAQTFADAWKQVLLYYPQLDYSIEHPTNQLAKQSQMTKDNQAQDEKLFQIAKHYGLFFFYRSTCPYCHRFAPILKAFAENYGFTLLPITLDENVLEEFPDSKHDEGQAQKFGVSMVPALFAVNPKNNQVIPITYGLVSWQELKEQLNQIRLT